jgi:hypothetical protein
MNPRELHLETLLRELYATVKGECPALLNEDSGGNSSLDLEIEKALDTSCQCPNCLKSKKQGKIHTSDCAVHNAPAYPIGECDCGLAVLPSSKVPGNADYDRRGDGSNPSPATKLP